MWLVTMVTTGLVTCFYELVASKLRLLATVDAGRSSRATGGGGGGHHTKAILFSARTGPVRSELNKINST